VTDNTEERRRANRVWNAEVADLRAALGLLGTSRRDLTGLVVLALLGDLGEADADGIVRDLARCLRPRLRIVGAGDQ
jgi:hypothetical protein